MLKSDANLVLNRIDNNFVRNTFNRKSNIIAKKYALNIKALVIILHIVIVLSTKTQKYLYKLI